MTNMRYVGVKQARFLNCNKGLSYLKPARKFKKWQWEHDQKILKIFIYDYQMPASSGVAAFQRNGKDHLKGMIYAKKIPCLDLPNIYCELICERGSKR